MSLRYSAAAEASGRDAELLRETHVNVAHLRRSGSLMSAANYAPHVPASLFPEHASGTERLLRTVVERSGFVAALTDDDGTVVWATPAFLDLMERDGSPIGRSLFSLAEGRGYRLAALLAALGNNPHRQATAEIDVGAQNQPHAMRITAEKLAPEDGGGVLWWQHREVTPERVERLTHALRNIAREVEWVGFGRRRHTGTVPPLGLLDGSEQLTDRERAVATMLANGDTVAAIASRLYVSPSTVRNYLSSMYRKLAVRDLAGLRELLARSGSDLPALRVVDADLH